MVVAAPLQSRTRSSHPRVKAFVSRKAAGGKRSLGFARDDGAGDSYWLKGRSDRAVLSRRAAEFNSTVHQYFVLP